MSLTTQQRPARASQDRAIAPAQLHAALDGRDAHCRQRELVRLSLLAVPATAGAHPTHRRWAA